MKVFFLLTIASVLACGREDNGNDSEGNDAVEPPQQEHFAMVVQDTAGLPTCDESRKGQLVYVKNTSKFQTCDGSAWAEINIKGEDGANGRDGVDGADGISVAEIWEFHTDTYVGAADIADEAAFLNVGIGDVRLVKFSDESAFITVSGYKYAQTTSTNEEYTDDWSYSFIASGANPAIQIFKMELELETRIRFTVGLGETPTFKAVVDIDGDFSDNTDTSIPLTKQ